MRHDANASASATSKPNRSGGTSRLHLQHDSGFVDRCGCNKTGVPCSQRQISPASVAAWRRSRKYGSVEFVTCHASLWPLLPKAAQHPISKHNDEERPAHRQTPQVPQRSLGRRHRAPSGPDPLTIRQRGPGEQAKSQRRGVRPLAGCVGTRPPRHPVRPDR